MRSSLDVHRVLLLATIALMPLAVHAAPWKGGTIQAFDFAGGSDGANPAAGLLATATSTAVGTTRFGGGAGCGGDGCGTVYQITTSGIETELYAFQGGSDGANPSSELFADSSGDVYGTTQYGGGTGCGGSGCGTIFIVTTIGQEEIVPFSGAKDGAFPLAGMVAPPNSYYAYGTTSEGGGKGCGGSGCGTVFEVSQTGEESVVHAFKGGRDGADPVAALIADKNGNLYGTTASGGTGCGGAGCGTVFEITSAGKEIVLYKFKGGSDGSQPLSRLSFGANGALFGTTSNGGANSLGTVFSLDSSGKESVLYSFKGGKDGSVPISGVLPCAGKCTLLFGTTEAGGGNGCSGTGCGTIYELDLTGKEKVLYAFAGSTDGADPVADLFGSGKGGKAGKHGYLYGTAYAGGAGCGGSGCGTAFTLEY